MYCLLLTFFIFFLHTLAYTAPMVASYNRFHSNEPTPAGGAILFSELGCANCHGGSVVAIPRKGPSLENIASRVNYDWLIKYLKNPEYGRQGSNMPSMLHGATDEDIEAVASYLSTYGEGLSLTAGRHANPEIGKDFYHQKGCVACHGPSPKLSGNIKTSTDTHPNHMVSFPDLKQKTSLVAMEHFLTNTSKYRTDGRMPHMDLGRDGAINIAAHLLNFQGSDPRDQIGIKPWPKPTEEQLIRGKVLAKEASCAACHDLPEINVPGVVAIDPQIQSDEGCLSPEPKKGLPRYLLNDHQRKSLLAFLKKPMAERTTNASLTLQALNCLACHVRDEIGGPPPHIDPFFKGEDSLGDSGRLPPPLTGIGHKLRREWLEGVLNGDKEKRARPYVQTVMPAYPGHAKAISEMLLHTDKKTNAIHLAEVSENLEAGKKILGTQGGANCITCHHWGKQKSLGIPGLDISSLDQRLKPEWFRSYLLKPSSYRPGTLMPSFWPNGRSSIPEILKGDTEKQIATIWKYIAEGTGTPEGFPNLTGGKFELKPTTHPIVQRSFFEGVGTKTIVVGFPEGIHLAYDGDKARPAKIWRGAFFDAYSTWFMRMAPFEKPLSDDVFTFPNPEEARRFRGYTLDKDGVPTFLFTEAGRLVKERFEIQDENLIRILFWDTGYPPKITHPDLVEFDEVKSTNSLKIIYRWK